MRCSLESGERRREEAPKADGLVPADQMSRNVEY